jgi:hypothetical protein
LLAPVLLLVLGFGNQFIERPLDTDDLGGRQDAPTSTWLARAVDERDRVCPNQSTLERRREEQVKQVEMTVQRPRRESLSTLVGDVPLDSLGSESLEL